MAAITDKLSRGTDSSTGRPIIAQLASSKGIGATSITINAATNWTTSSVIPIAIYTVTAAGVKDPTSQTDWIATLTGTTLSNMTLTGGTDRAYNAGAYVEITLTGRWLKNLYDWAIVHAAQDGTLLPGAVQTAIGSGGIIGNNLAAGSVGPTKLALLPQTSSTAAAESTAVQTYTDLTTVGPAVTATIGANGCALVTVSSLHFNTTAGADNYHSFAVSGASTQAATDARATSNNGTAGVTASTTTLVTGLTAGSNTFTSKYRVSANTGTWINRTISVVPL
jgi:hypothetical protein